LRQQYLGFGKWSDMRWIGQIVTFVVHVETTQ
jgi:hypothetical protein